MNYQLTKAAAVSICFACHQNNVLLKRQSILVLRDGGSFVSRLRFRAFLLLRHFQLASEAMAAENWVALCCVEVVSLSLSASLTRP